MVGKCLHHGADRIGGAAAAADHAVKSHENARVELIRVRVNPEDIGRVIGRSGRTANAIRTVVQALSDHKVRVDIMDVRR